MFKKLLRLLKRKKKKKPLSEVEKIIKQQEEFI